MIKLTQLIKELDINKPIPKFRNDNELMKYLNSNIGGIKDEFIRLVLTEMEVINEPSWDYVIKGWEQNKIFFDSFNGEDEVLALDDEEEDVLYFTINSDKKFLMFKDHKEKIQLGPNIIYFKFH